MINSADRMDYIADYIASYKTKIQLLNRQGLFDNATLFELFAENVCSLWFGKTFKNLNLEKSNYPYVDLIGSALAVDLPSDSEVNQQTTGYAGVISIALASRKIPPMLS